MLDLIPTEIITQIFTHLNYRDLFTCSLVCHLFRAIVQENASCQYAIELAVSSMRDGPPGPMGHADRLTVLRNSQAAWHSLRWTAMKDIRMLEGSLYELYGGVLAQSNCPGGRGLVFRRLPSHYRGIEEHVWPLDFDFVLRDFALDPAQDLLVLVGQPIFRSDAQMETPIYLRSLSTGKVHPLVTESSVLTHDIDLRAVSLAFMLQIHSDCVAVHFVSHGTVPSDLVVWNWKTGEMLLNTYSADVKTFAFLAGHLIMVGSFSTLFDPEDSEIELEQPRLTVVNLDSCERGRTRFEDLEHLCAFHYPVCHPSVQPVDILIRSDPSTDWTPHPSVRVPFSVGTGQRLYIVTIWIVQGGAISTIDMFVLSDTLMEHIGTLGKGEREHHFTWSDWGPNGTRMIERVQHSHTWVCYVFGTRFSSVNGGRGHRNSRTLEVWDFNQLGIKRDIRLEGARSSEVEWHVGDTSVVRRVFMEEVHTRLPYRVVRRKLDGPLEEEPVYTEAMCSEDSILLVDPRGRHFRVMTF